MTVTVDLNPQSKKHNPKQREYFDAVMGAVSRSHKLEKLKQKIQNYSGGDDQLELIQLSFDELQTQVNEDCRYFMYGGAVSGGKSIISMAILVMLCEIYPNSRWHIIRKASTDLDRTVKETMREILGDAEVPLKRSRSDEYYLFKNGSRIYLMAESFNADKDLNRFKGLLTNGFLLEQMEELQKATFFKAIERAGRWHGVKGVMPPPLIFGTFNPTFGWLKKDIHDLKMKGQLEKPYYYLQALPNDNPWNTDEQWRSWSNMDEESYARFIEGLWDIPLANQFFSAFKRERNVGHGLKLDTRHDIYVSFDFNVDPMTCVIGQSDGRTFVRALKEFRQPDSDTYALCELVKEYIKGYEHIVIITGDASGNNRMSGTRGHINQYNIIKEQLDLKWEQFEIPSVNPLIADSRTFMNSLFSKLPEFLVDSSCEHLINDLMYVESIIDLNGNIGIKKKGTNKYMSLSNNELSHLSDCLRYFVHRAMITWNAVHRS